jgi:hypothetical protein
MPVMRVSEAAVAAVESWARPLETRRQVLDRIVKVAVEGPPADWLTQVLGDFVLSLTGPIYMDDVLALAQHILSRWPELREQGLTERLGADPEEGGGES